jgi:hypothetical protein
MPDNHFSTRSANPFGFSIKIFLNPPAPEVALMQGLDSIAKIYNCYRPQD